MKQPARASTLGGIRLMESGRFQPSYPDPTHQPAPGKKRDRINGPSCATFVEADVWLLGIQRKMETGQWEKPRRVGPAAPGAKVMTLRQWTAEWMATRQLKDKTRKTYTDLQERILLPHFGDMPLNEITRADVQDWFDRSTATGNIRAQAYSHLSTLMKHALRKDKINTANPCQVEGGAVPPKAKRKKPLKVDAVKALVEACEDRYKALAAVMGTSGLRISEARGLQRQDIDLDGRKISVETSKTDEGVRDVPIYPWVVPLLRTQLETYSGFGPRGWVFPGITNPEVMLSETMIRKALEKASNSLGRRVAPHLLRHSAATNLIAVNKANAADVQQFLGHTDPTMTMRYMHSDITRLLDLSADDDDDDGMAVAAST